MPAEDRRAGFYDAMMRRRAHPTTVAWLPSAVALVIGSAGLAHADTPDQQFLAALASDGITGHPGLLVDSGHDVCDWQNLAPDENPWSPYGTMRSTIIGGLADQGLRMPQINQFIRDAIVVYCPDKKTW